MSTAESRADEIRRVMRTVAEFRAWLESIGGGASVAVELIHLDRLVRRYPAAARKSLELAGRDRARPRAE